MRRAPSTIAKPVNITNPVGLTALTVMCQHGDVRGMNLADYLTQHDVKVPAFASRIGVSSQALHRYLDGDRRPKPHILERIHQVTGGAVQPNDFFTFIKSGQDLA